MSGLDAAFAAMRAGPSTEAPKHSGTQEPKPLSPSKPYAPEHPSAQELTHPGAHAPTLLGSQVPKRSRATPPQAPEHSGAQVPTNSGTQAIVAAKSCNPDFEAKKFFIRKDTMRRAKRRWEDQHDGERDVSDLMQYLLERYLEEGEL